MSDAKNTIIDLIDPSKDHYLNLETYNKALSLAKDEEDFDLFRCLKLIELIGFTGTNNFDCSDMIVVLKFLKRLNTNTTQDNSCSVMEKITEALKLPYNYICLIFCTLSKYNLVDYGISLQNAWITDDGIEILNPEYTLRYKKILEKHCGYELSEDRIF